LREIIPSVKVDANDLSYYSFFSKVDSDAYFCYSTQQAQMWIASEIPYTKDLTDYNKKLTPRMRKLIDIILGFFSPGDGLVNASVLNQMKAAKTQMEAAFLWWQGATEVVHQQVYGLFIKMFAGTLQREQEIFNMVNDIPCVKRKAEFIQKYIDADIPDCLRNLAQALVEGVFFVSLFAIIFYFRRLNLLEAFVFANEQISKDETLHRDYFCIRAEQNGIINYIKEAHEIVEEAISIETEYIEYLLKEPIQDGNLDELTGLTIPNLVDYVKLLADQILIYCGLEIKYNTKPQLSWMSDIGLEHKNNFYERKVGNYKKGSLQVLLNWEKLIGNGDESDKVTNGVIDFEKIAF
jgi:ribonucleoside-diphosphate reductase subunit M2